MQTIIDECVVYLCVDGDGTSYDYLMPLFPDMDLRILYMPENRGCGQARQYGMDAMQEKYFTFIDADDTFSSADAVKILRDNMEDNIMLVVGNFYEEYKDSYIKHEKDLTWMHGKLYRKSVIDKYDLRFSLHANANEDSGFNTIVAMITNDKEGIKFVDHFVYQWHWLQTSTVRANNQEYAYKQSVIGLVYNKIYAIEKCRELKLPKDKIDKEIMTTMINLFKQFMLVAKRRPDLIDNAMREHKKFYDGYYKKLDDRYIMKYEADRLLGLELRSRDSHTAFRQWKKELELYDIKKA